MPPSRSNARQGAMSGSGSANWMQFQRAWLNSLRKQILNTEEQYGTPATLPPASSATHRAQLLPDAVVQAGDSLPVRTVVVDLDETLVHAKFHQRDGWMIHQRPGAAAFLAELSKQYEIVLFTSGLKEYAQPIISRMDPMNRISHCLFRDSTLSMQGLHVKDISCLNRDPARVIIMDNSPEAYVLQPENALPVQPYFGDDSDTYLYTAMAVLQDVFDKDVTDVRTYICDIHEKGFPSSAMRPTSTGQSSAFPVPQVSVLIGRPEPPAPLNPPRAPQHHAGLSPAGGLPDLPEIDLSEGASSLPSVRSSLTEMSPAPVSALANGAPIPSPSQRFTHSVIFKQHGGRSRSRSIATSSMSTGMGIPSRSHSSHTKSAAIATSLDAARTGMCAHVAASAPSSDMTAGVDQSSPMVISQQQNAGPAASHAGGGSDDVWALGSMQDVIAAMSPPPAAWMMPGAQETADSVLQSAPEIGSSDEGSPEASPGAAQNANDDEQFQMDL